MNTKPKGPFLGINNRRPALDLHVDKVGDFLADAENVDVDGTGNLVRRHAPALVQEMSGAHSLYASGAGDRYLVRGAVLYAVTLPTYAETMVKVLTVDAPVSYAEFNGSLYYSNGTDSGRIAGGVWHPMALPTPDTPAVTALTGSLFSGAYQIAISYTNTATGEEGGVSASENFEVTGGGLRVMLPGPAVGATHVNVYMSTVNGSIPMLVATVAASTAQLDFTSTPVTGREATQRYEAPLPAGRLFLFNGTLCSHIGSEVFEGLPFRPGYYLPLEGRIPFPAEVSNVVPVDPSGAYVVADKTYWFEGSRLTLTERIPRVLPYGGVKGTAFASPNKSLYGWFGAKGVVLASPTGEVEAVMSDNVDLTPPASGVSGVFETGGYRRVVSCGWCVNLDNKAATRYTDYPFTSISGGYGTRPDGLYAMSGGDAVDAVVDLGNERFGTEQRKMMPAAYLGYASPAVLELSVSSSSDDNVYSYPARSCSDKVRIHRVDPGRGLIGNSFQLVLRNTEGADFTLSSVSFADVPTSRRI